METNQWKGLRLFLSDRDGVLDGIRFGDIVETTFRLVRIVLLTPLGRHLCLGPMHLRREPWVVPVERADVWDVLS